MSKPEQKAAITRTTALEAANDLAQIAYTLAPADWAYYMLRVASERLRHEARMTLDPERFARTEALIDEHMAQIRGVSDRRVASHRTDGAAIVAAALSASRPASEPPPAAA